MRVRQRGQAARVSDNPFVLPDHSDYAEILTDAAVHVLEMRGVAEFSVAAMARWMKVSPQAVHNLYSRSRAIEIVIICFCRRWLHWSASDYRWLHAEHPCPLRIPREPEERHGTRVLHALTELARGERVRGNPLPELHLAQLRTDEGELLRSRLAQLSPVQFYAPVEEIELNGLMAVLSGLRYTRAVDPASLTWEQACRAFARAVSAVAKPGQAAPTSPQDLHPPHEPAA
jgi:hypothetical protein